MKKEFLIDRVQEINAFISFIINQPELFNAVSVHKFFDSNIPDTKAGEIIDKYSISNFRRISERLAEYYPEYKNVH